MRLTRILEAALFALCTLAVSASLTACATQLPPQIAGVSENAERGGSWMLPEASGEDLIYATSTSGNAIYAFSYPTGKLVGKIVPPSGTISLQGLCADNLGYFYVTSFSGRHGGHGAAGHLYKYRHGATRPKTDFTFGGTEPFGCAFDATTKTLAVSAISLGVTAGFVETIPISGSGKIYYSYYVSNYYYCGYDDKGNLFVNGTGAGPVMYLEELRKGASGLKELALNRSLSDSAIGQVQWDGRNITLEDLTDSALLRLSISGSKAKVVGTTHLDGWYDATLSWLNGSTLLVPTGGKNTKLGFWNYPSGGKATRLVDAPAGLFSVTVSAPAK
ncbi:MAG: hypothetical protein WAK16_07485 [Candidatus Cybelea sp.]